MAFLKLRARPCYSVAFAIFCIAALPERAASLGAGSLHASWP